ncbi:GNAT family N-acetyltransferase [Rheinheimera maricola]|uniref:GNAT family N-acetyltransferase n=1 Tax=Rheinheimera maricola TaxID=2793282 RepID=A0ABS7X731_9GAMM|nr:GNAT family N-acetyltransferase [Rheinheimera maricola]MBZ9610513.1 GNAT family N-acetyltransferase [Rheinheimera maricola]
MNIRTARLEMTPLAKDDWPLFQTLHNTEQVIAQCFDPLPDTLLQQKFQRRLVPWHKDANHWLCLVIRQHGSGEAIGITGMCVSQGRAEVGYLLLPAFYGRGFGTESLQALIQWALTTQGISRFKAVVTEGNTASERVLQKAGFQLAEKVPQAHSIAGKRYADHIYHFDAV